MIIAKFYLGKTRKYSRQALLQDEYFLRIRFNLQPVNAARHTCRAKTVINIHDGHV
jgi:hypothetical protein